MNLGSKDQQKSPSKTPFASVTYFNMLQIQVMKKCGQITSTPYCLKSQAVSSYQSFKSVAPFLLLAKITFLAFIGKEGSVNI